MTPALMTQSRLDKIQALLFDTYGTVVDWRGGVLKAARALGQTRGLAIDWDAFLADWNTRPILDRINDGQMPWMTMEAVHRHALGLSLTRFGVTDLTDGEIDQLVTVRWRLGPWPDSVPGLTRLKQRYVISPLSNASFIGMVKLAKFAGLPWDCIITAENARRYKPHPAAYHTAVSLLGLKPDEVLMVAAHNYDLRAAQAEGLLTAFVPRPAEYGPGQTTDLTPEGQWTIVATDFGDLATRLGT
ncbi:MAG: haloacid dehalogenase type II [Candidatus Rokuibacteriota bacterium]|nr:MAG: haloacid dehalogenase type II [Candidatus Rokubacteria bacterium]